MDKSSSGNHVGGESLLADSNHGSSWCGGCGGSYPSLPSGAGGMVAAVDSISNAASTATSDARIRGCLIGDMTATDNNSRISAGLASSNNTSAEDGTSGALNVKAS